jgi:hypothetical protein
VASAQSAITAPTATSPKRTAIAMSRTSMVHVARSGSRRAGISRAVSDLCGLRNGWLGWTARIAARVMISRLFGWLRWPRFLECPDPSGW